MSHRHCRIAAEAAPRRCSVHATATVADASNSDCQVSSEKETNQEAKVFAK